MENLTVEFISINDIDANEWHNFLLTTSESTFFCTTNWWRTFDDSFVLQIRNKNKELIAGIPFRILSIIPLFGQYFRFCWSDSSALVNQKFNETEISILKKLTLDSLIKHLLVNQIIVFIVSSKTRSFDAIIFRDLGFEIEKCATLILDITKEENEIFKLFSKGNKSSIRKAQKLGVQVKINEGESAKSYITDFCNLQRKLFENKKESYSNIYYKSESYLKKILSSDYFKSYLAIAYYNDQPAAGALLISHNNVIYYYLGATDTLLTRTTQASNFLHYEIIKYAKETGFLTYDFGGIPFFTTPADNIYGVYIFKKSFGGNRFEYDHGNYVLRKHRYWIISNLRKNENHPVFRFIYNLLKK